MSKMKMAWLEQLEAAVEPAAVEQAAVEPADPVPESEPRYSGEDLDGPLHEQDAMERDFERGADPDSAPVPEGEENAPMSATQPANSGQDSYPDLSNLTTTKVPHSNLILEGVCSHCAHCGHQLTDAQSIQRGIGPVCSRKGYSEDPVDGDEMQAMIDLAEFPELVEFLTKHYKPLGIRGLVNGLVRVASLNRPHGRGWAEGNPKVHAACCDAVESLGHRALAKLLRETLVIMEVRESDSYPGCVEVWVKRRDWVKQWSWDVRRDVSGSFFCRRAKATVVPLGDKASPKMSNKRGPGGQPVPNRRALWDLMLKHYGGAVAKVKGEPVKITEKGR